MFHGNDTPFSCTFCVKKYTTKRSLNRHVLSHSKGLKAPAGHVTKNFSCTVCCKMFISNQNLVAHVRIYTGDRPFSCTKCDKTFTQRGNLKTHEERHHQFISCSKCYETFSSLFEFYKHMKIHTKEDQFNRAHCNNKLISDPLS